MKQEDHDALLIFVLAFTICGLHGIKSCQEREEKNGQQPTTRSTILPTPKAQETKVLQSNYDASSDSPSGAFSIWGSDTERVQK